MNSSFEKLAAKAKLKAQLKTAHAKDLHGSEFIPKDLIIDKQDGNGSSKIAAYVTGKTDNKPSATKFFTTKTCAPKSIKDLLKPKSPETKNEESKNNEQTETPRTLKNTIRSSSFEKLKNKTRQSKENKSQFHKSGLHGTGFTKELGKRSSAFQKLVTKAKAKDKLIDKVIEEKLKQPLDIPILDVPVTKTEEGLEYDRSQEIALHGMAKQKYAVLIGAAGTGKTTVVKQLIDKILNEIPTIDYNMTMTPSQRTEIGFDEPHYQEDYDIAIGFGAYMGRAVQQMKKNLPEKYHKMCNTIHATLGYAPVYEYYNIDIDKKLGTTETKKKLLFKPTFTAENKLPFKVFVVDEAGTVPIPLWNELIAALPHDCRVFEIGDINQLTPVQGRSPLGFSMLKWPTYTLENIHRQAAGSPILRNCHHVLKGEKLETDPKYFAIMELPNGTHESVRQIEAVVRTLHKRGKFDPLHDAIITPQNRKELGQEYLNERFVNYFNPMTEFKKRLAIKTGSGTVNYMEGDKIMLLQNDRRRGLTNGMTGIILNIIPNPNYKGQDLNMQAVSNIEQIDFNEMQTAMSQLETLEEEKEQNERQASHITTVKFYGSGNDQEVTFETAGDYGRMQLGYSFTCHKMQGSECPTVIIIMHSSMRRSLYREWLYTAISRAQHKVIILTTKRALAHALAMQKIKGDSIKEKAKMFMRLQGEESTKLPNLPKPKEL